MEYILKIGKEALYLTLIVSAPAVLAALLIGLAISILQATTQIQEQSLTFVPKLVGVFVALIVFGPSILEQLTRFAALLLEQFPYHIR